MDPIIGSAKSAGESKTKGWVVGHMHEGLAGTSELEVKLWHYDGPFDYGRKTFQGTELITIYGGILKVELDLPSGEKKEVFLRGSNHEYLILPPGTTKRVIVLEAPAFGDCIRWPSAPGASQVVEK